MKDNATRTGTDFVYEVDNISNAIEYDVGVLDFVLSSAFDIVSGQPINTLSMYRYKMDELEKYINITADYVHHIKQENKKLSAMVEDCQQETKAE